MKIWTVNRHCTSTSDVVRRGLVCSCERVDLSGHGCQPRSVEEWGKVGGYTPFMRSGWNVDKQAAALKPILADREWSKRGLDLNHLLMPEMFGDKRVPESARLILEIFESGRVPWWSLFGSSGAGRSTPPMARQLDPVAKMLADIGGVALIWAEIVEWPLNPESITTETMRAILSSPAAMERMPTIVRENASLLADPSGWSIDMSRFKAAKSAFAVHAMKIVHASAVEMLRVVGVAGEDTLVVMPNGGVVRTSWVTDDGLGTPTALSASIPGAASCDYLLVGRHEDASAGKPFRDLALARAVDKARALSPRHAHVPRCCHKLIIEDLSPREAAALGPHLGAVQDELIAWSGLPDENDPAQVWRPQSEVDAVLQTLARSANFEGHGDMAGFREARAARPELHPVGAAVQVKTGAVVTDMRVAAKLTAKNTGV